MIETNLIEDLRLLSPPDYTWAWGLLALLGAVAATVAWWRVTPRRAAPNASVAASSPALWDTALLELERLVPLLEPGHSRDYGIQATGILRGYIEARYHLRAPRLATEEFLVAAAQSSLLPGGHRDGLERFLGLCDLFKFGRYVASADELGRLHSAAVAFVLASKPLADGPPATGGSA